jgi:hypothetical protein
MCEVAYACVHMQQRRLAFGAWKLQKVMCRAASSQSGVHATSQGLSVLDQDREGISLLHLWGSKFVSTPCLDLERKRPAICCGAKVSIPVSSRLIIPPLLFQVISTDAKRRRPLQLDSRCSLWKTTTASSDTVSRPRKQPHHPVQPSQL